MSEEGSTLGDILEMISSAAKAAAPFLGPKGGAIMSIIGTTLESGAAIAEAGGDPVKEIERIHSEDPYVGRVKQSWKDRINKRFPDG